MGLQFDSFVDVSPDTPIAKPFDEWVSVLYAGHPITTVRAYVGDVAVVAESLLRVLGRAVPDSRTGPDLPEVPTSVVRGTRGQLSPVTFYRARDAIGHLVLGDLHPRNLGMVFDTMGADRSSSGVRRAGASMTSFCDYLVRRDLLADNPMRSRYISLPRAPQNLPYALTLEDAARLVATVAQPPPRFRAAWPARDLAVLSVFLGTGIRLSEGINACVGDIMRTASGPSLRVLGKGSKTRQVFMPPESYALTKEYLAERALRHKEPAAVDPLFVRNDGTAFSPRSMESLVDSWFRRAGVRRLAGASVHTLRHSYSTWALQSGATIREVQECLGHASLDTTRRYLSVTGEQVAAVALSHPVRSLLPAAT